MLDVCHDDELQNPHLKALLITYDGLLEPMGSSQVLPYVEALADDGVRTRVLSFEKASDLDDAMRRHELMDQLDAKGIEWTPLRYHKRPRVAGTLLDVFVGALTAIRMARARRVQIVHARSYVPGLIGCSLKFLFGARFVFDMRGFWPEERVEMELFRPQGLLYRLAKRCERFLLGISDHIVVLTESAKGILRDREANARMVGRRAVREKPITVIPCCTDLERFQPRPADRELTSELGLQDKLVIGNIGAVNKRYMLPEMFRFAFHVNSHRPDTRFVYLTRQDESLVRTLAQEAGLRDEDLLVASVEPSDIPRWLSMFRLGVFFLRPSYAAKASSYTKLAEFLACGVPVVTNTGVGDVDQILGANRCGVLVPGLTETDLKAAARQALALLDGDDVPADSRESCRATAEKYFALEDGARRFLSIYRSLASPGDDAREESVAVGVS
ncbi:MAG: glycosyltransferase family 4 protein [Acidobacteriota bacterium]|nr:MAG: glycosyltransferase family 4 protein [Acidobacteriota bacterium]